MGYQTDFNISNNSLEVQEAIMKISDYSGWGVNGTLNSVKWYDHIEHCIEISKQFPDQLITVSGQGEEAGDLWVHYYKNGRVQKAEAKITFDEFDESKLVAGGGV